MSKYSLTFNSSTGEGTYTVSFKLSSGYQKIFYLYNYPTSNCQVFSIAPIQTILSSLSNEEALQVILESGRGVGSIKQLLADVKDEYLKKLEEIFPAEAFVVKSGYISTNDHKMNLCLIKLDYKLLKN